MSKEIFSRSEIILGSEYYKSLEDKSILLFGLGGVGGYIAEILVRSGIKNLTIIDGDAVEPSNINRQIIASHSSLGKKKTELVTSRLLDINPECNIKSISKFLLPESTELDELFSKKIDYVVDAVDTIALKVELAFRCEKANIPIISATGCGNRFEAEYKITDIFKTSYCPVCRILRKLLKEKGVKSLTVLYSPSPCVKGGIVASVPWTPAMAGITIASYVVLKLLKMKKA